MTWREAIREASARMREQGIDDHATNAKYLAAHVLGVWSLADVGARSDSEISAAHKQAYDALLDRRIANEPLQYILGETEFYGLRLNCTPAALIPRPETEILVETAIEHGRRLLGSRDHLYVLDIGTGTGAIALSVGYHLPAARIVGIDASAEAIELASENKARLADARTRFVQMDVMSDEVVALGHFDLILSNPPYVSTDEYELLPADVRGHEPRMALTDESDGLIFYRRIAEISSSMLRPDGAVIVELSYDGVARVSSIFEERGFRSISSVKDLAGIARILVERL
ncbi:MAG TPA: peptide chain release factor N(5)-glutamine methyltransferase [Candidatus Kapabacteria bacterium]|nr:peptide chain release factor N(5)-glutamine methyltransferase [Candidatus Kapabacteria bacterium]